jgi:DNA-binding MarR family transcriptional regulator
LLKEGQVNARDEQAAAAIDEARRALDRASSVLLARPAAPEGDLIAKARCILRNRQKRAQHLPNDFFGEPAWDALLALYIASNHEMRQIDLFASTGTPQSTALRWLRRLEEEGLVVTRAGPNSRTKVLVQLTAQAQEQLTRLLKEL